MSALKPFHEQAHALAVKNGFYDTPRRFLTAASLIISEYGELVEAIRKPAPCTKIPSMSNIAEELADIYIRQADTDEYYSLQLSDELEDYIDPEAIPKSGSPDANFIEAIELITDKISSQMQTDGLEASLEPIDMIAIMTAMLGNVIKSYIRSDAQKIVRSYTNATLQLLYISRMLGVNLGQAVIEKHKYNLSRSYRHGNKLY